MTKAQQVHALRACSLVVIPPSEERMPPPEGFPRDLSGMNLTSWAGLIQDVAQGMKVVPPNLSMEVCLDSMVLLQLLEATMGMGYCRICCQPSPRCHCLDDYQLAPMETWSQMMARMPGQGVVASIAGPTTPGTATAEVQEQEVPSPPPGLHPLDFTNWSLPFPEAPPTGGLPAPSGGPPGIGKTVGPWAPGQWALAPPMQVPSTPQGTLPVHQPRPRQPATPYQQVVQPASQSATPYQQAVQPPRRPVGRGLTAQPPSDRATPAAGQTIPNRGRPQARGWGIRGRSVNHPGRGRGTTTNVPSTTTPGATQSQPGRRSRPRRPNPAMMASKYHSSGWRRDLEHVLKVYYKHTVQAPFSIRLYGRQQKFCCLREYRGQGCQDSGTARKVVFGDHADHLVSESPCVPRQNLRMQMSYGSASHIIPRRRLLPRILVKPLNGDESPLRVLEGKGKCRPCLSSP